MKVDVVATEGHYLRHLLPIFEALPPEMQGVVRYTPRNIPVPRRNTVALVAGWQDVSPLRGLQPMIYVEHGAGQSYGGDPKLASQPSYSASGGARHTGVVAFLSPNSRVAAQWKSAPAFVVGCPKLDEFRTATPIAGSVCFAWHWDCEIAPEAGSAWTHWRPAMRRIVASLISEGREVFMHAHPRWRGRLDDDLQMTGAKILGNEVDVFRRASTLCADNTSLMYEFAALDRPVVALNAPQYRRNVHHGLRFWDTIPGPQANEPDEFSSMLFGGHHELRRQVAARVYEVPVGQASAVAARHVTEVVRGLYHRAP